jgi:hypothetical protein
MKTHCFTKISWLMLFKEVIDTLVNYSNISGLEAITVS